MLTVYIPHQLLSSYTSYPSFSSIGRRYRVRPSRLSLLSLSYLLVRLEWGLAIVLAIDLFLTSLGTIFRFNHFHLSRVLVWNYYFRLSGPAEIVVLQPPLPLLQGAFNACVHVTEYQHGIIDDRDPYFTAVNKMSTLMLSYYTFQPIYESTLSAFDHFVKVPLSLTALRKLPERRYTPRLDIASLAGQSVIVSLQYNLKGYTKEMAFDSKLDPFEIFPKSLFEALVILSARNIVTLRFHPLLSGREETIRSYMSLIGSYIGADRLIVDNNAPLDASSYDLHLSHCSALVHELALAGVISLTSYDSIKEPDNLEKWFHRELASGLLQRI